MTSRSHPATITSRPAPPNLSLRKRKRPQPVSRTASLDELQGDLEEVERLIRVLEWASVRPKAA